MCNILDLFLLNLTCINHVLLCFIASPWVSLSPGFLQAISVSTFSYEVSFTSLGEWLIIRRHLLKFAVIIYPLSPKLVFSVINTTHAETVTPINGSCEI